MMKMKTFVLLVTALTVTYSVIVLSQQASLAVNATFYCDKSSGTPITFVSTGDGKRLPIIRWIDSYGLSPDRRCMEVSQRFQARANNGNLRYIQAGSLRGLPVICAPMQKGAPCTDATLLFTLRPGSNANAALRRLLDRRALAAGNALEESGGKKPIYIDLVKYLNSTRPEANR
jgi:Circadian oscillating protein COP23